MINVIMPMAGNGLRVKDTFNIAKPLIPIKDVPMFCWALESVNVDAHFVFVVRNTHIDQYSIDKVIQQFFPVADIVVQYGDAKGPAYSVMEAEKHITDDPLLIMDCDMYLNLDYKKMMTNLADCDGVLGTFLSNSVSYSYIDKSDNGMVKDIREKETISSEAVGGSYFWKNGKDFVKHFYKASDVADPNKELYMSAVYKSAIGEGKNIKSVISQYCYDLSTKDGMDNFMLNRGLLDIRQ